VNNNAVGIIALVAAIVAFLLVPVSFLLWIAAALTYGGESTASVFMAVLIGAVVLALAAIIVAVVRLLAKAQPGLSIATIVVGILPFVGGVALFGFGFLS